MAKAAVLVRWKQKGADIVNGLAEPRNKGDEDIMKADKARNFALGGLVDIIGPADETTIPTISAKDVIEPSVAETVETPEETEQQANETSTVRPRSKRRGHSVDSDS